MTSGEPYGHLWRYALPLLLGNWLQLAYNAVDSIIAGRFIGQNALADRVAGREGGPLASVFRGLPDVKLMKLDELFVESQDALQAQVNPLLVLDTMATAMYALAHERR